MFQLFKRKYVYSPKQQTFKPLDAMPAHLPRQICSAFDDLRLIHTAGLALAISLMLSFESCLVSSKCTHTTMLSAAVLSLCLPPDHAPA